jgi:iron complex transport system ATP-binding protein
MIVWDQVSVAYTGRTVLGPVTVEVGDGEWIGLIGPNGAGKSTMLKAALGLVEHSGTVRLSNGRRRPGLDIAWMPQRPTMPEKMGVWDYVMLGRSPHIGYLGSEGEADRHAVAESVERLDLTDLARRPLETLSGGEAQRALLARALAQEAPVLLLDEPTANLDVGHAVEVMEVIDGLRRSGGLTVVTAIHDLTLAGRYCSRLVFLAGGAVVADGSARHVLTEVRLRPHYGGSVRVIEDEEGPLVVPGRSKS